MCSLQINYSKILLYVHVYLIEKLIPAEGPRNSVLLEMYLSDESIFNQSLIAYRLGEYKLIRGTVRDDNYYYESYANRINSSSTTWGSYIMERALDTMDYIFGKGPADTLNIIMVHMFLHDLEKFIDGSPPKPSIQLYNIVEDPCERYNLANEPRYAAIIDEIDREIDKIAANRHPLLPMQLQLDISYGGGAWSSTHIDGDCSTNANIPPKYCKFTHSWVPDVSTKHM